ncbi:hypothetical protein QS257_17350 [Terrilactibacillus sp. S3-3]|nr:hypothetical protein QS257_17350 [Terrilactibacillus sp. S3-3]
MKHPLHETIKVQHPLEPLTVEEVDLAVSIIKKEKNLDDTFRIVSLTLNEPEKSIVLNFKEGDSFEREAALILLHNEDGRTYEAIVSLNDEKVIAWKYILVCSPPLC